MYSGTKYVIHVVISLYKAALVELLPNSPVGEALEKPIR